MGECSFGGGECRRRCEHAKGGVAAEGRGVAIVLHDLVHAQCAADDVLVLHGGRVAAFGPPAETLTPDLIRAVFGIRVVAARDGERGFWVPAAR